MGLSCPRCQAQISLEAERISGNLFLVPCPTCRTELAVECNVRPLRPYPDETGTRIAGSTPPCGAAPAKRQRPSESHAAALRARVLQILQGGCDTIPLLNKMALRVRTLIQDPQRHGAEIIDLVRNDQALAARLFRLAYSAYYGRAEPVADVGQAVRRVGFRAVETLVLVASTRHQYRPHTAVEAGIMAGLWDHGLAVATAAKWIAQETTESDPERAFLAGLLHDIGRALGLWVLGETTWQAQRKRRVLSQARIIALIDAHHAELGAMLLEKWAFSPDVVIAVRGHHAVPESPGNDSLPVVLALADLMVRRAGLDVSPLNLDERRMQLLALRLGLSDARLASLEEELGDLHAETKRLLAA